MLIKHTVFPGGSEVNASACNAGDLGSIPGSGRSPGEGNGNPLQYSCLENPMDGGAWWATVHRVAKSQTRLSNFTHSLTQTLAGAAYPGSWLLGYLALTVWSGPRVLLFSCSLGSALKHLTSCPFFKNLKGYYQVPLKQLWFRARHVLWQRHREHRQSLLEISNSAE